MTTPRNEHDRTGSATRQGARGEHGFIRVAHKNGYTARHSTDKDDIFNHVDFHVTNGKGHDFSVDVKGLKKMRRNDPATQDTWIWIEYRNVQGELGWIFGKADIIAFELEASFLLVRRERLAELVTGLLDGEVVRKPEPYKLYSRTNRRDVLTIVHVDDLLEILGATWNKPGGYTEDERSLRACKLCEIDHFHPLRVYEMWIAEFGMYSQRKGRDTKRTLQTRRWEWIVQNHQDNRRSQHPDHKEKRRRGRRNQSDTQDRLIR